MGRQAYITRLALGRSPYDAPLLSETGDFILGPYAHEFDNPDTNYTQQFNERGHPEFPSSRAAARDLRRAKNDVLSTVGVVYKKAKPTRSKRNEGEMIKLAIAENDTGFLLSGLGNVLMLFSLWWLFSLRMRVQAFEGFYIPVLQIIKTELRTFGMKNFLLAGLPASFASAMLSSWRKYWMSNHLKQLLTDSHLRTIFGVLFFWLYSSIEMFGILQSLHLIPAQQTMSLTSLIRPTLQCALSQPTAFFELLTSPFLLLWVHSSLDSNLTFMLWHIIRSATPKPSKPDRISRLTLEQVKDAEDKVPGLRDPTWTMAKEMKFQSNKIKDFFRTHLKPLFMRLKPTDRESSQDHPERTTSPSLPPAHPSAHPPAPSPDRSSTATPDPEDIFVRSGSRHNSSPRIWFDPEAGAEAEAEAQESRPQPLWRINSLFTPLNQSPATTPPASPRVRASLIHHDSETVTMQLELVESFHPLDVEGEVELRDQPIDPPEAAPLTQNLPAADISTVEALTAEAHPDPSEPTMSIPLHLNQGSSLPDPRSPPAAQSTRPHSHHQHRHHHHSQLHQHHHQQHQQQHRVTALSNFPTDAFASHAACWLTTFALLPLEALFVRSLARTFLANGGGGGGGGSGGSSPHQLSLLRPLFGLSSSSLSGVGRGEGWKTYYATMLALMGVQALVSSVVWGVGTAVAVGLGRGRYRWGAL